MNELKIGDTVDISPIQEQSKRNRLLPWISINDRLPEFNDDVLVTGKNRDVYMAHLSEFYDEPPEFYCHSGRIIGVTHWMTLPEAPHE